MDYHNTGRCLTMNCLPNRGNFSGTQLFGLRESNWELRTLTGVIFGLGVCWFLLPQIQSADGVRKHE